MIKIERTSVVNFENALRGMRNPMNSWDRSDSYFDENGKYIIGENDLSLAVRLARAGSDDRKYLRQIFVSVDVTAPLYWWKEYDTYKVGTVANSTSTMHKIHSKEFSREDFSCDRMSGIALTCLDNVIEVLVFLVTRHIILEEAGPWGILVSVFCILLLYSFHFFVHYLRRRSSHFSEAVHGDSSLIGGVADSELDKETAEAK